MARSYDFEATQSRVNGVNIPSHTSGTTVTTALTLGEAKDISGKELITALLVGDDVACRILAASGFSFSLGWDNVGTVNAFGATAIAGRLLGLSEIQLQNAFGIVLNQLAGSFDTIWDGVAAFKLFQGLSARNGIFSAELAKAGWTGPKDALLGNNHTAIDCALNLINKHNIEIDKVDKIILKVPILIPSSSSSIVLRPGIDLMLMITSG